MSLAESIRMTRQKAFQTQEAFAGAIHVSVATINRWENGKSKPNLSAMKNIKEFCSLYNLPYDSIEQNWFGSEVK